MAAYRKNIEADENGALTLTMKLFKYKRVPYAEIRAFSVHILTASGSFLAFLGVVAAAEHRFVDMFWWLGLALAVDGIDGPIARKVRVKEGLPNWSEIG